MEIWKKVEGFENYEVSNYGNVRNSKTKKEKKCNLNTQGYLQTQLSKNNVRKNFRINRLVAITFIPNENNYTQVNHIDGNKLNNHVDNLEWCLPKENIRHAIENKLRNMNGSLNPNSKLSLEDVIFIKNSPLNPTELAEMFGVSRQNIHYIKKNKTWCDING